MLVFVRYIFPEDVHEDRLYALLLQTNTTAADLLSTHCVIQRVMLVSRKMSSELNVLHDVIKVINHVKVHALSSRLFKQLCEEMDAEHKHQVHWLSKGRSLARVFELRELLQRCLSEKQSPLAAHFSSTEWVVKLAYMCDIFSLLNGLNLSLQGRTTTVLESADKVAAFKNPNVHLLTLAGILEETEPGPPFSELEHDHLSQLSKELEHDFPTTEDPHHGKEWIRDPFASKLGESMSQKRRLTA